MALAAHTKRIMVIDDLFEGEYLYSILIDRLGHGIAFYDDPLPALAAVRRVKPSLIVTDVCLPQMDGYQVLDRVRLIFPELPFLIVSATPEYLDRAAATANCLALEKPFENARFLNMIRLLLPESSPVTLVPVAPSDTVLLPKRPKRAVGRKSAAATGRRLDGLVPEKMKISLNLGTVPSDGVP